MTITLIDRASAAHKKLQEAYGYWSIWKLKKLHEERADTKKRKKYLFNVHMPDILPCKEEFFMANSEGNAPIKKEYYKYTAAAEDTVTMQEEIFEWVQYISCVPDGNGGMIDIAIIDIKFTKYAILSNGSKTPQASSVHSAIRRSRSPYVDKAAAQQTTSKLSDPVDLGISVSKLILKH